MGKIMSRQLACPEFRIPQLFDRFIAFAIRHICEMYWRFPPVRMMLRQDIPESPCGATGRYTCFGSLAGIVR